MAIQIQVRRDTAANWGSENPTPASGEPCFETDTGVLKFGDGTTAYNSLTAFASGASGSGGYTYTQSFSVDGAPSAPSVGDTWFELDSSNSYLRYTNGGTPTWIQTGSLNADQVGSSVTTGTAITLTAVNNRTTVLFAPTTPTDNVLVSIPRNSDEALDIGFTVRLFAQSVGGVSLNSVGGGATPGLFTGITLRGDSPYTNISVNEAMDLQKIGTDNWLIVGGTS